MRHVSDKMVKLVVDLINYAGANTSVVNPRQPAFFYKDIKKEAVALGWIPSITPVKLTPEQRSYIGHTPPPAPPAVPWTPPPPDNAPALLETIRNVVNRAEAAELTKLHDEIESWKKLHKDMVADEFKMKAENA